MIQAQGHDEERQREASRLEADNHELRQSLEERNVKQHETETMSMPIEYQNNDHKGYGWWSETTDPLQSGLPKPERI